MKFVGLIYQILLFGLLFVIYPFGFSQYELPKVSGFIFLIGLLMPVVITASFSKILKLKLKNVIFDHQFFWIIFLFLFGISFYNLFWSKYPELVFWGNVYRPQGTLIYLGLFLLFLISYFLNWRVKGFKLSLVVLVGFLILGFIISPSGGRMIGSLGEPNAMGATVLFLFPWVFSQPKKVIKVLGLLIAGIIIILSGSKGAMLGLSAELLILLSRSHQKMMWISLGLIAFVYVSSCVYPFVSRPEPPTHPYEIRDQFSKIIENRADIWKVSYQAALEAPILGYGFGSIEEVIREESIKQNSIVRFQTVDHAHNIFLNWWITNGILGLLVFVSLILYVLQNLIVKKEWVILAILIGLLIVQSYNPLSIVNLVHFWWVLGIGLSKKPSLAKA